MSGHASDLRVGNSYRVTLGPKLVTGPVEMERMYPHPLIYAAMPVLNYGTQKSSSSGNSGRMRIDILLVLHWNLTADPPGTQRGPAKVTPINTWKNFDPWFQTFVNVGLRIADPGAISAAEHARLEGLKITQIDIFDPTTSGLGKGQFGNVSNPGGYLLRFNGGPWELPVDRAGNKTGYFTYTYEGYPPFYIPKSGAANTIRYTYPWNHPQAADGIPWGPSLIGHAVRGGVQNRFGPATAETEIMELIARRMEPARLAVFETTGYQNAEAEGVYGQVRPRVEGREVLEFFTKTSVAAEAADGLWTVDMGLVDGDGNSLNPSYELQGLRATRDGSIVTMAREIFPS